MVARLAILRLQHVVATCYHPLFVFNPFGDLERCALRAGNVHSADGWDDVLKPVVARYQGKVSRIYFRADAAFAMPAITANYRSRGTDIHHLGRVPSTGCSTGGEDREYGGRRLHSRPTGGEIPGDTARWHVDAGSNQRIADPGHECGSRGGGL